jgi:hypothetical protein
LYSGSLECSETIWRYWLEHQDQPAAATLVTTRVILTRQRHTHMFYPSALRLGGCRVARLGA